MNQVIFGAEAREKLRAGVDQLANAVKVTFGAKGRNVIISRDALRTQVTKDGVTVAKSIVLNDPIENIGADFVKEVASKTNDLAGDGTTTATILTQALINEGFKSINNSVNLVALKKGMDVATAAVVAQLHKMSKSANTNRIKKQIATVSANGDNFIGGLIADTLQKVGTEGIVRVEESLDNETTVEFTEGMNFDNGYMSSYFINNPNKAITEFVNPMVLIYDGYVQKMTDLVTALKFSVENNRPMLIISEDVEAETLSTLAYNCMQGQLKVACVKAPGFGDRRRAAMDDIAALTGAVVVSKEEGGSLLDVTEDMLGGASKIIITKEQTSIIGGKGEKTVIQERITLLKSQIEAEEKGRERTHKEERLSKLTGGAATIKVGGNSEVEKSEKKDRIDDALCATIAASEEGYLAGGGVSYLAAQKAVLGLKYNHSDEVLGHLIVAKALEYPFLQILNNAGIESKGRVETISGQPYGMGVDVVSEKLTCLFKAGIIDPTKVSVTALENAVSVAGTFLTCEVIIYNEESFM